MTEEVAAETPPAPPKGTGNAETEKPPENNEASAATEAEQKKGKKRKKSFDIPKEFLEPTRERSSRKAASKAALQISMNIMHQASNQNIEEEVQLQNGYNKKSKKVKPDDEILSSSPLKFKPGPRCTKVKKVKPGPMSKRRRLFQYEDLYLDQPGTYNILLFFKYRVIQVTSENGYLRQHDRNHG